MSPSERTNLSNPVNQPRAFGFTLPWQLPIFENTDTKAWLETYERFLALEPKTVIPGHGVPTNVHVVTKYSKDYLAFLRGELQKLLDEGSTLANAYKIDQSACAHLYTFEELAARNAGIVFEAMEFE